MTLVHHGSPGEHQSCHSHSDNISSDEGDYEERLDDPADYYSSTYYDDPNAFSSGVSVDLGEEPGSLLNFLRDKQRAVMEGLLPLVLSIETEIALYDQIISQLDCELTRSKETEKDLCDKWNQSAAKSMDQLRRLKDLKETNRLMNESLQHKIDEMNELLAMKHRLDEMVKQATNNFFRSQLEKMHRENDQLQF